MNKLSLILLILLVACQAQPQQKQSVESKSLEFYKSKIDSLFQASVSEDEPGVALLIAYDGQKLMAEGYGLRNLEAKEPITTSTNMRMASVSKQFTALAVLSMVDQGLLSLDDQITKHLPYKVFEGMTIEMFINHTSGLADYEAAFMEDWDPSRIATNKDILEWYKTGPPALFEPGERWEYSNGAYNLLASIIEKVSGQEFSAYAREHVFQPSGMRATNYFNLAQPIEIPERSNCYEKDGSGQWQQVDGHFLNGLIGEGSIYTSVNDYFAYDQASRNKNIVSDSLHDIVFKPSSMPLENWDDDPYPFRKGKQIRYAMGWEVFGNMAMHSGAWYGTRTITLRLLDRPLTIAIFMNSNKSYVDLLNGTYDLMMEYLENEERRLNG